MGATPAEAPAAEGILLLDKPSGLTSHDCVAHVRKACPRKTKVGHSGTLDPFSTGLLILLIGRGTRLAPLLQGMDKTYEGILRFGEGTDTLDRDGKVVERGEVPRLSAAAWQEAANRFVGTQEQVPPDYSAKHVAGQRAYDLARQGLAVDLPARPVTIFRFEVEPVSDRDVSFRLSCSSGTYIRAVARDMGLRVGCPAHCLELRRTCVGPYGISDANPLDDPLRPGGRIAFDAVDLGIPLQRATSREEALILNGQAIPAHPSLGGGGIPVKILGPSGNFLALAKCDGRMLHPATVFPPPRPREGRG